MGRAPARSRRSSVVRETCAPRVTRGVPMSSLEIPQSIGRRARIARLGRVKRVVRGRALQPRCDRIVRDNRRPVCRFGGRHGPCVRGVQDLGALDRQAKRALGLDLVLPLPLLAADVAVGEPWASSLVSGGWAAPGGLSNIWAASRRRSTEYAGAARHNTCNLSSSTTL